ncbi:hypothetical protein H5410_056698 [Solanum commersonii]|uniref:Uncharacterized protein n=1 Tax=Solanum commersonii TaxID=4109 RepID=A0A9J5WN15_SOLCO|nr:hypothetical protein H5410_056698 [Solanum commersonii]
MWCWRDVGGNKLDEEASSGDFFLSRQQGKGRLQLGEVGYSHTLQKPRRLGLKDLKYRALWKRFILGKYSLFNRWTTEEVMGIFGCSVWKTIIRLWPHFKNNICIGVGDGWKTVLE